MQILYFSCVHLLAICSSSKMSLTQVIEQCILLVIVGVAPNDVITYVSKLYPGSISENAIVQQPGLLNHQIAEDLVLADKGFLIQDLVPDGVSARKENV